MTIFSENLIFSSLITLSEIFYLNDQQKEISEKVIKEENIKFSGKIVTKTSLVKNYCPAEEYHQKYLEKR